MKRNSGMNAKIKRLLSFLFYVTGLTSLLFYFFYRDRKKILVLLYHRVKEPEDSFEVAVSPANFEMQMRFLKKHFNVIPLRQALAMKEQGETSEKPVAAITFDDGYRDNLENAFPILKKYSLPATFFLAAGSIGNHEPMWTSRVESLFKRASVGTLNLSTLSPPRSFKIGRPQERMKVCHIVKTEMKKVPDARRQVILEELENKAGPVSGNGGEVMSEMLSWDDVRKLAQDPLAEIGSHSVSHRMLAHLPPEEIERELKDSKMMIETEIGRKIHYVSYPGNSYSPRVQRLAEEAGYCAAFAVDRDLTSYDENNFSLKRMHIENEPLYVFRAEIALVLTFFRSFLNRSKPSRGDKQ